MSGHKYQVGHPYEWTPEGVTEVPYLKGLWPSTSIQDMALAMSSANM